MERDEGLLMLKTGELNGLAAEVFIKDRLTADERIKLFTDIAVSKSEALYNNDYPNSYRLLRFLESLIKKDDELKDVAENDSTPSITNVDEKQFNPKSNEIDKYIQPLWEFLNCDVIENPEYTAFRKAIYAADLNLMYKRAEEKKTVGRFRIAMGYVKTWFDDEWEDHAVANIGISKDLFRKYNIKENRKWCKKLEEVFKKYQPLHPHPASPRKIFD